MFFNKKNRDVLHLSSAKKRQYVEMANIFQRIPAQIWAIIFSHICFITKPGLRLHRSFLLLCKAGRQVTELEIVWQARLAVMAVHLGVCRIAQPRFVSHTAAYGLMKHGEGVVPQHFELVGERSEQQQALSNKFASPLSSSSSSSSSLIRLGSRISSASSSGDHSDAASLVWRLELNSIVPRERQHVERPFSHALFNTATFSLFSQRVKYVVFLFTARCCVCGFRSCRVVNRAGFELGFEFHLSQKSASDRESKVTQWAGLRICMQCCVILQVSVPGTQTRRRDAVVENTRTRSNSDDIIASQATSSIGVAGTRRQRPSAALDEQERRGRMAGVSLGPVTTLPADVLFGGATKIKEEKVIGELRFCGVTPHVLNLPAARTLCDPFSVVKFLRSELLSST